MLTFLQEFQFSDSLDRTLFYTINTSISNNFSNLSMAGKNRKESAIPEVKISNPCPCNSENSGEKVRVCTSRSQVRKTGEMMSAEEGKIRAELAKEIEKGLQKEIEEQIWNLRRRLEELRLQSKSEISVKKSSLRKGALPKNNNVGTERKEKFKWESSLRSSRSETGSFKRRPWNDLLSDPNSR